MSQSRKGSLEREQPIAAASSGDVASRDAVLTDLTKAAADYKAFLAAHEQQARELEAARAQNAMLAARVSEQKQEANRQHARAEGFRHALADIQRATFRGDVYDLVLQSCIRLTEATRGMYISVRDTTLRVRANIGVDGSRRGGAPSTFMSALARRVMERDDAVVCGDDDTRDLPAPRPEEKFTTCAAIPVSIRGVQRGVLIVLDKQRGAFDEHDLETLLHVGDQASIAVDNAQLQRELEQAHLGTVGMLADAVETKDPYTAGHCEQVSHYALSMATAMGLDDKTRETVCLAALLHDIGKICISDGLLNKPGPLMPEEREVVRAHARIGHDLVGRIPALQPVAQMVLHHHEWFDGSGYPAGLAGASIPIGSRIVAVIDSYCAMIDRRSYKAAMDVEASRAELQRCAGTQFDPEMVALFLEVLDAGDDGVREQSHGCGILPQVRRYREEQQ